MKNQQPTLAARSSAELAEGDELQEVRSNISNHSAADTICVAGGPSAYMLPGVPRAPFVRLYEGDARSWGPEADEGKKEAYAAYEKALNGHPLKLSRCIGWVLTAGAAVPGRLKWLALSERARIYVRGTEIPPPILEEVRMMVGRYSLRTQLAEYGRMTRVLLAHAAEVEMVMGDEDVGSMGAVAMRMYERAVHENYGSARVIPATDSVDSAEVGIIAAYLMEIPDCQKCGLYDCLRCGKSRQLQLIELYEEWKEPVVMVVRRIVALVDKEERRLLDVKRMEVAKARYGKIW